MTSKLLKRVPWWWNRKPLHITKSNICVHNSNNNNNNNNNNNSNNYINNSNNNNNNNNSISYVFHLLTGLNLSSLKGLQKLKIHLTK